MADGIDYLSKKFQFWSMSGDCRIRFLLMGSSVHVCLVVLKREFWGSSQYKIPHRMLQLDANTIIIKVMYYKSYCSNQFIIITIIIIIFITTSLVLIIFFPGIIIAIIIVTIFNSFFSTFIVCFFFFSTCSDLLLFLIFIVL